MTDRHARPGHGTVVPYLIASGVDRVLAFARKAFGAEVLEVATRPDGSVRHAEVRIGDSVVMMGEANAAFPPMPACLYVYVGDTDAAYAAALGAGAQPLRAPTTQSYGDRNAGVIDPAGNHWWVASAGGKPPTSSGLSKGPP
jgi:uncharacterized glyoxalase superfamily protein PhnB